jgi:hypothetical protein
MSAHRSWADISDSEDIDSFGSSEFGEERLLPETVLRELEFDGKKAGHSESFGVRQRQLNVYAAEFVPTLSMSCPLVGICEVIVEGDELELESQEDVQNGARRLPPSRVSATMGSHRELPRQDAKASKKPFWRKSRQQAPAKEPQLPTPREELTEEQVQRRLRMVEAGQKTKEYRFLADEVRRFPSGRPQTPDPRDSSLSKRGWDKEVQQWRKNLRRCYLLEVKPESMGTSEHNDTEAPSMASTEADEAPCSEADETITVHSDLSDASSAHWCSR